MFDIGDMEVKTYGSFKLCTHPANSGRISSADADHVDWGGGNLVTGVMPPVKQAVLSLLISLSTSVLDWVFDCAGSG